MTATPILSVNVRDLLQGLNVENERLEFKAGWNPKTTGPQVLRTICAFANDFHNLNGGYILLGVEEHKGRGVLPPQGLTATELEAAQKWIRGQCNRITPKVLPIIAPESFEGRPVLVLRVPASDARPHRVPDRSGKTSGYWIRIGSETVDAEPNGQLPAVLDMRTSRPPWDDRQAVGVRLEDIRESLVREHLSAVESALLRLPDTKEVYRRLGITVRVNDHDAPRNVALLLFSSRPDTWFRGAVIEFARVRDEAGGDLIEDRVFRGSLTEQLEDCLRHVEATLHANTVKSDDRIAARRWVSYPRAALREALINAIYHRSYEPGVVEPTKVWLYPDRAVIASYPGPVPGIRKEHFEPGDTPPLVAARNRRIGEFLRERKLAEGRLTGIQKMRDAMEHNGSPPPQFDFDETRTYFQVTLPAHPEFTAITALEDASYARAIGKPNVAFERIRTAWRANSRSATLAAELVRLLGERGEVAQAEQVREHFLGAGDPADANRVTNALLRVLADRRPDDATNGAKAKALLRSLQPEATTPDALESAILAKRLKEFGPAHRYFEKAGESVWSDVRALHEFAQTKIALARQARRGRQAGSQAVHRRLLAEALACLDEVTRMEAPDARHAWAWRDLGQVFGEMRQPEEQDDAYRRATKLLPDERRFAEEWATARQRRARTAGHD